MNCIKCGFNNPSTTAYCTACGARLDYTVDEIRRHMDQKRESEDLTERNSAADRLLVFAIALFLLALTIFFMAGSPPRVPSTPSLSRGLKAMSVEYRFAPGIPEALIPLEEK